MNSDRSFIESITDDPAPHYEAFLRYLQSTQPILFIFITFFIFSNIFICNECSSSILNCIECYIFSCYKWLEKTERKEGRGIKGGIVPPLISVYAPLYMLLYKKNII
nr:uncharacterized protein LOC124817647 isoform X1 [Hydra vulgaris]